MKRLDGGSGGNCPCPRRRTQHWVIKRGVFAGAHGHEPSEIADEVRLIDIVPVKRPDPGQRRVEHELRQTAQKPLAAQQQFGGKAESPQ